MAKTKRRDQRKPATMSASERKARELSLAAERTVRLNRKLARLAGEVRRTTTQADDALRHTARLILERDELFSNDATTSGTEREPVPAGGALDPRD